MASVRGDDLDDVAVGVAPQEAPIEAERATLHPDDAGRNESGTRRGQACGEGFRGRARDDCLPVDEIVRALVGWGGAAVAGAHVFEKFDTGPRRRAQTSDPEPRAGHGVEPLLLGAVVETRAGDPEPQQVAIEAQARVGARDDDRRVVDSEEQSSLRPLPLRVTLAGRKLEDFERMVVRIPEIEGADPAGVGVPVREALRRWRHPPHAVRLEHGVGAVHVAYDDRHVLEPAVVAARVRRGRTARRSGPGHQLQRVDAEPEANDAHARAGHALEAVVALARRDGVPDLLEPRSEERRVGEEGRSRWSPYHLKKKKKRER